MLEWLDKLKKAGRADAAYIFFTPIGDPVWLRIGLEKRMYNKNVGRWEPYAISRSYSYEEIRRSHIPPEQVILEWAANVVWE